MFYTVVLLLGSVVISSGSGGYGGGYTYNKIQNAGPMSMSCPLGWQAYHTSCYYFSREKLSWWKAHAKCSVMGGFLAHVNYAHENSYLKLMCQNMKLGYGVWFGLNDILHPKSSLFLWGFRNKACRWFDWYGGKPQHYKDDYNCACFREDFNFQWSLQSCTMELNYVCEMDLVYNVSTCEIYDPIEWEHQQRSGSYRLKCPTVELIGSFTSGKMADISV